MSTLAPQATEALTSEERFYLPWNASGLTAEFGEHNEPDQKNYARLCARSHNIIANRILQWMENPASQNNSTPLSEQLYREAAQLRRAIEWRPRENGKPKIRSGFPMACQNHQKICEIISPEEKRYKNFHAKTEEAIRNMFDRCFEAHDTRTMPKCTKELFGENYSIGIHMQSNGMTLFVEAHEPGGKHFHSSEIFYDPSQKTTIISHTSVLEREHCFAMADQPFKRLLKQMRKHQNTEWNTAEREIFWKDVAELSLHLYHAAPLQFGSQTATLTILAGICKASGLKPAPGEINTDHFLDAEIIPYPTYIKNYQKTFGKHFAEHGKSITHPLAVDTSFLRSGLANLAASLEPKDKTPKELAQQVISTLLWSDSNTSSKPITVPTVYTCDYKDGRVHIEVEPKMQKAVDNAIEFTGHEEIAVMLGLAQTKQRVIA